MGELELDEAAGVDRDPDSVRDGHGRMMPARRGSRKVDSGWPATGRDLRFLGICLAPYEAAAAARARNNAHRLALSDRREELADALERRVAAAVETWTPATTMASAKTISMAIIARWSHPLSCAPPERAITAFRSNPRRIKR